MRIATLTLLASLSLIAGETQETPAALEAQAVELCRTGHYREAERIQLQALRLWTEAAPARPVDLSIPNVNLAQIYIAEGKLTAAEQRLARAVGIRETAHTSPANSPQIAALLGKIRFLQGRYEEAAKLQQEVVRKLESGPSGEPLAVALNDLAMIKAPLGELREARSLLERSVTIYRGIRSASGLGESLGNLALVCARQGDDQAAVSLYAEAVATMEATLGPAHPHLGMVLAEHAKALRKTGRKSAARQAEQRAKQILASATALEGLSTVDASALR